MFALLYCSDSVGKTAQFLLRSSSPLPSKCGWYRPVENKP